MADFKGLYRIHQSKKESDMVGGLMKTEPDVRRKYRREKIIGANVFTDIEKDFLDWLLVDDEYYIDDVIEMIKKEMERVVN